MIAVESLASKGHSVLSACDYLSLSRATYYRDIDPTPSPQEAPRGVHPSSLTVAEEQQVIAELNSDRFSDVAIPQV